MSILGQRRIPGLVGLVGCMGIDAFMHCCHEDFAKEDLLGTMPSGVAAYLPAILRTQRGPHEPSQAFYNSR
jgi:hypothetical protein